MRFTIWAIASRWVWRGIWIIFPKKRVTKNFPTVTGDFVIGRADKRGCAHSRVAVHIVRSGAAHHFAGTFECAGHDYIRNNRGFGERLCGVSDER